jgi:hypothetical protein
MIATWSKRRSSPARGAGKSNGDPVRGDDFGTDRAVAGAEGVSGRRVQRGIHEPLHGEGNVLGGERAAVGKRNAAAEFESDLPAVFRNFPRLGQFGFEVLRFAVGADQDAARQIADGKRRIVIDQQRIESLRLGAQAEAQLAAALGEGGARCQGKASKSAAQNKS